MTEQKNEVIRSSLEQLGLTEGEISVYETTLRVGTRPASVLAKLSGINRTCAYDVLDSLKSKGLIERVERNKVGYFSATSPENVVRLLKERQKAISENLRSFQSLVPELLERGSERSINSHFRRFRGAIEVKDLMASMVKRDTPLYGIGDIEAALRNYSLLSRWSAWFGIRRLKCRVEFSVACPGEIQVLEEPDRLKQTFYHPDIPDGLVTLVDDERFAWFYFDSTPEGGVIENPLIAGVVRALHSSWMNAVANSAFK